MSGNCTLARFRGGLTVHIGTERFHIAVFELSMFKKILQRFNFCPALLHKYKDNIPIQKSYLVVFPDLAEGPHPVQLVRLSAVLCWFKSSVR